MEVVSNKRSIEGNLLEVSKKSRWSPEERSQKVVQEVHVGITAYINDETTHQGGFYGQIKLLYSDFQVNEIDLKGNVVRLTDDGIEVGKSKMDRRLEKRKEERQFLQDKSPEDVEAYKAAKILEERLAPKYILSDQHRQELLTLLLKSELDQIEQLFSTGNKMETKRTFQDKQTRGKIHQLLRVAFQGTLETVTSPENSLQVVIARRDNKKRQHSQESINFTDENGVVNYGLGPYKPYIHLTVFKENRDLMEIANTIAKFLRFPTRAIGFAGTKDRRGATCQRYSIHRGKVVRVNGLSRAIKGSVFGGFTYQDKPLGLGDLSGNEFAIVIRDVKAARENQDVTKIVAQCFESLKTRGFLNYYGMQRFGSFSVSTHELGVLILKEDYRAACDLILSEQEVMAPDSIEGRRIWAETRDASLALKKMPRKFAAEHLILSVLAKHKSTEVNAQNCFEAIMSIPKNLRIMYAHAYQSYIWNLVVLKRFELFGVQVQVGDLVIQQQDSGPLDIEDQDFPEDVAERNDATVKPLTQEDIDSGKYSIFDIVLPSPGYRVTYPTNAELVKVYVEAMEKDGLHPSKMMRRVKEFSLRGSYRRIMCLPGNLSYEMIQYIEDGLPIYRTDLEMLDLKKKGITDASRIIKQTPGPKLAVVLKMQLESSSYATMALREFMRADTARFGTMMVG